jgi:signal peptidase II
MKKILIFIFTTIVIFIIDQYIKEKFVLGYDLKGSCIDFSLHYNKGVAFSMFAFLGEYLKWIQKALIGAIIIFIFYDKAVYNYPLALGLILGGAIGNLYDRFIREGVVDYVAWHCGFDFAVFNFADVMIDLGVAIILLFSIIKQKEKNRS